MREIIMPPLRKGDRRPSVEELEEKARNIKVKLQVCIGSLIGLGFMFIVAYAG